MKALPVADDSPEPQEVEEPEVVDTALALEPEVVEETPEVLDTVDLPQEDADAIERELTEVEVEAVRPVPPSGAPPTVPSGAGMPQSAMRQMRPGVPLSVEQLDDHVYSSDRSRMHPRNTLVNQLKNLLIAMFAVLPVAVLIGLIESHQMGDWSEGNHWYEKCHWYNYTKMFRNVSDGANFDDFFCIAYEFEVYSLSGAQLDADNCNMECVQKFEDLKHSKLGSLLNTANGHCKCAVLEYYSDRMPLNYTCQSYDNYTRTIASQGYARDDVQMSEFHCTPWAPYLYYFCPDFDCDYDYYDYYDYVE